ncbi:DNA-binding transcriptional regulator, AcrR family [Actinoplanes philippinensis]|uniref:DNA-binding transcriptional regulator, AcrR family n=1 Tax=Actinoplanes philippinensis TaxID=35752 RepID=A0A1I2GEF2_9ACTN|nr:helix-turn-helix domain-containing protein [Actinoplanes philippinensis]SFF15573.1 DNA-binding transcriptional regulator, AcrR family [Actinoplanes philippinensis]
MSVPSGSRARTRQAILDAAIEVLARNPAASLGDVAEAADVGRTTLHRYFPERGDLIAALRAEATARLDRAGDRARLGEGPGGTALVRLCQEYFDLGDVLSLLFREQVEDEAGSCDEDFDAMVRRGHADGSIDPELPPVWVQNLVWSQLYAGWSYQSEHGASRHDALRLVLRCVSGAVRPQP